MFTNFLLFGRLNRGDREYYSVIKNLFGIKPNNIELYKLAMIHRSASLLLDDGSTINNERLEFLGDAVIESIVSDYLFIEFPEASEGFLTQMRSRIVNRMTLNTLAKEIGIDKHLIANGGGSKNQHIFGDALEAVMGAMYLDKGYDFANRYFINEILHKKLDLDRLSQTETDYKSRILEWSQKNKRDLRFNTEIDSASPSGKPRFITSVALDGEEISKGEGHSKKEAEQLGALRAIENGKITNLSSDGY